MSSLADAYYPFAERFEGSIPWMYLDTKGKVTVGIGHMIPDADAATRLPFTLSSEPPVGRAETADEIAVRSAFAVVATAPEGMLARRYERLTVPRLSTAAMRAVHEADTRAFLARIRARFDAFDSYPLPARLAVLDMAYNLGLDGLWRKFPRWRAACLDQDWRTCAKECRRRDIQASRNLWTRQRFLEAAGYDA
jgi:GH24 family phage-related lysozyme (muramidase)